MYPFVQSRLVRLSNFARARFDGEALFTAPCESYRRLASNLDDRGPRLVDGMIRALGELEPRVRREAALALMRSRWSEADVPRQSLWSSDDPTVARVGVQVISRLYDPRLLLRAVQDACLPSARRRAADALARFNDHRVRDVLDTVRRCDFSADVRAAAGRSLAIWLSRSDPSASALLREIARDPAARRSAEDALELGALHRAIARNAHAGDPALFNVARGFLAGRPRTVHHVVELMARMPRHPPRYPEPPRGTALYLAESLVRARVPRGDALYNLGAFLRRDPEDREVPFRVMLALPVWGRPIIVDLVAEWLAPRWQPWMLAEARAMVEIGALPDAALLALVA